MDCRFSRPDPANPRLYVCEVCGVPWIDKHKQGKATNRNCRNNTSKAPPGPGDYLHDAILKWVGETPTRECGCKDRIARMNCWGPVGCREHLDEIIDWMMDEAKQRGWWRYAVAVPGSRLFVHRMVLGAIRQAEGAST